MARIRTIKPDFFTSEDIVSLSPLARLLYIALWCEADREGRFTWRPATFKLRYFPGDRVNIEALCKELIHRELVVRYGGCLAYIPSFLNHQHVNPREANSSLPPPDASARVTDASPPDSDAQVGREGKERKEGRVDATSILTYLNEQAGKDYKPVNGNLSFIAARLEEGASVEDCKAVIERKCREWKGGEFEKYLRPATLFNATKFAQYQGEKPAQTLKVDV